MHPHDWATAAKRAYSRRLTALTANAPPPISEPASLMIYRSQINQRVSKRWIELYSTTARLLSALYILQHETDSTEIIERT